MSLQLLDATVAYVRAQFTKAQVAHVAPYAGEFNATEVGQLSYACPAILITVLGWQPTTESKHLTGRHVREVRMAAFVAYKHASRDQRMRGGMALAEALGIALRQWAPAQPDTGWAIGSLEGDASCENLFSRAIDDKGQSLWLVDWRQCVKPLGTPAQLFELLAIDIVDRTRTSEPTAAPAPPGPLTVTEDVRFVPTPNP